MKTSTKIFIAIAGVIGAGALVWYFTQKRTAAESEEKLNAPSDAANQAGVSKGSAKGNSSSTISPKGGNRVAWSPTRTVVTKISRLVDTPLGNKLNLKSAGQQRIDLLQQWFDQLDSQQKRLLGYLVYLNEQRIASGELPAAIESKEGTGSWEQIIRLSNQMKDIADGNVTDLRKLTISNQMNTEEASFAFGGYTE